MTTVPRNRIEKILPRIIGGKRFTLENHFHGETIAPEQIIASIRMWRARQAGRMTLSGTRGSFALHSNHWIEFEVAA